MKILVYGAGVLGSYLAYEFSKVGHDVYILARGKRYDALKNEGLIIEHHIQKQITVTNVNVVNSFDKMDEYDAVFVVMQRTQIDDVLPILAKNEKCKLYVLVGNNGEAEKTYSKFINMSHGEKTLLFGFQGSGGRRENNRVISIHKGKVDFAIGNIIKDTEYKKIIDKIFDGTKIKLWYCDNIDSWLKYHLAVIMPIAYAVHWAKGDMKKISKSKDILYLTLQAIQEGIELLINLGYPPEPKSILKILKWPNWVWYLPFKIVTGTKIGSLAAGDHAMAAINEMNLLFLEFLEIKRKSNIKTPSLDKLESYLIKNS